jgi:DNA-binding NarL/FixJ family response regulator
MDTHMKLTERERNVLRLFSEGMNQKDVADELGVSSETVEQASISVLYKLFAGSFANTLEESTEETQRELISA